VIPDSCVLQGTVRTFGLDLLDLIERRMDELCSHTAAAFGASAEFAFHRNYPPTINHPDEAAFARSVMQDLVGAEQVLDQEPTMGAEDFAYMLQAKPGAYAFIGNGDGAHRQGYDGGGHTGGHDSGPCTLHNPHYDFNDELIPLGGSYWVELAKRWLARSASR